MHFITTGTFHLDGVTIDETDIQAYKKIEMKYLEKVLKIVGCRDEVCHILELSFDGEQKSLACIDQRSSLILRSDELTTMFLR